MTSPEARLFCLDVRDILAEHFPETCKLWETAAEHWKEESCTQIRNGEAYSLNGTDALNGTE